MLSTFTSTTSSRSMWAVGGTTFSNLQCDRTHAYRLSAPAQTLPVSSTFSVPSTQAKKEFTNVTSNSSAILFSATNRSDVSTAYSSLSNWRTNPSPRTLSHAPRQTSVPPLVHFPWTPAPRTTLIATLYMRFQGGYNAPIPISNKSFRLSCLRPTSSIPIHFNDGPEFGVMLNPSRTKAQGRRRNPLPLTPLTPMQSLPNTPSSHSVVCLSILWSGSELHWPLPSPIDVSGLQHIYFS